MVLGLINGLSVECTVCEHEIFVTKKSPMTTREADGAPGSTETLLSKSIGAEGDSGTMDSA